MALGSALRLTVLLLPCSAPAGAQGLNEAWRLVGEGRFATALEVAEGERDPLARAQARTLVLHHAGDLRGALAAVRDGLALAPADAWLLDQGAYLAISLRSGELARELCARLERAADSGLLAEGEAERYRRRAAELRPEAEKLLALESQRAAALARARWTVGAGLLLGLGLVALLALRARRSEA